MKQASDWRKPYTGLTRSLVIALDVGTTFSGVSYTILEPNQVPIIHGVTRFPGQEHVAGNSKIPSILYYDREGNVMAAGAEADNATVSSQAEDESWIKAELFKLRLRPRAMKLDMNGIRLSPLPRNKNPVDVFGDFLQYLFRCTRSFIIDTHANGNALWRAVEHTVEFVLSHPNGWEGAQQTKMRRAAVYGGLIPDTDEGRARIRFVTEGEASLHACVQSGLAADVLSNPSRHGFLVADAGGGTLDISSYAVRGTQPLVIEEVAPPDCIFAGSVFVSRRAREFFAEKLKNSKYGTSDSIDHITKRFDETTKRLFRDKNDIQWVPFGSPLDKDLNAGIRAGTLKLTGAEVAEFFEPSVQAAMASIKAQVHASQGMIRSVWLVGGFAASPWLFGQLQERLGHMKITVNRPDSQTSKAVADGALGFYCDHHVSARMSKYIYGVEYLREYDPNDPEHVARKERLCELPSGPRLLPDAFDCILARGVKVKESTVFTRKYCTELTNLSTLSVFEVEIWCYRGGDNIPPWILRHAEHYSTLCVVRADLSPLSGSAEPKQGKNGKTYWTIVFSVEIHFGLTEFKARIKWNDNGRTKYGPASIVYSESGHRADEDETDTYSEDDLGPSRSVSRSASRAASVAASRTHSQDSMGSGAKTPLGGARQEQMFMDMPEPSRSFPTPQPAPPKASAPPPQPQTSRYSERTREIERERTVSTSTSRVSSSVTHTERDRKASTTSTKISSFYASQPPTDSSEKDRRGRESEKEKEKEKTKSKEKKASKGASKPTSPVDLADSAVGKSPGRLAETLTSVWGSQSKSATPAASPFPPSARSVGPATPKTEAPPVDLQNSAWGVDLNTPGFDEAQNPLVADPVPAEVPVVEELTAQTRDLSLDIHQISEGNKAEEATGQTPADSVPPEQLVAGTPQDLGTSAMLGEQSQPAEDAWELPVTQETSNTFDFNVDTAGSGAPESFDTPDPVAETGGGAPSTFGWGGFGSSLKAVGQRASKAASKSTPGWGTSSYNNWSFPSTVGTPNVSSALNLFGGDDSSKQVDETGKSSAWPDQTVGAFGTGTEDIALSTIDNSNTGAEGVTNGEDATGATGTAAATDGWGDVDIQPEQPSEPVPVADETPVPATEEAPAPTGDVPPETTEEKLLEEKTEAQPAEDTGANMEETQGGDELGEEEDTGKKKKGTPTAPPMETTKSGGGGGAGGGAGGGKKKKKKK